MTKGRCLGLIGGLGVGATHYYYRTLAEAHAERGVTLDFVMAHAVTAQVFAYAGAGDREGLANYLVGFIERLQAAGAVCAAIPAVTPYCCAKELAERSPLPVFNIFDPLRQELAARGLRRVGMLGTRFGMETDLFGMLPGVEIVRAQPEELEYIHATYVELANTGRGTEEQVRGLTEVAQRLCDRDGAEAILLAGTDLTAIFNEANTDFPSVDCAALHLRAITQGMLGEA